MVRDTETCVLKTDGAFLTVRKFPDGLYLCAKDCQNEGEEAPTVHIWRRVRDLKIQMAFRFERLDGLYLLKVDGTDLKLEMIVYGKNTALTESHWFEKRKVDSSLQYHLHSVVDPSKSLSLDDNRFILSDAPAPITERVVA